MVNTLLTYTYQEDSLRFPTPTWRLLGLTSAIALFIFAPTTANAFSCPPKGPVAAGSRVTVVYDPADTTMKACINGSWVTMAGGGGGGNLDGLSDVIISSPANNQVLLFNGSNWVNSAVTITENDPKVGALTGNQWCAANAGGTAIVCNQAAPSGGGGTSSGTAGYVQISGGSGAFANSGTTAGEQLFWDNTNKRLGIGTTSPATPFQIGVQDGLRFGTGASASSFMRFGSAINTEGTAELMYERTSGKIYLNIGSTGSALTNLITAQVNGNVGIGTTSPNSKLDIVDASATGNTPFLSIRNTSGATPNTYGPGILLDNDVASTDGYVINQRADSTARFNIARSSSPFTEFFTILQNGNVGIGTATPDWRLVVSGGTTSLRMTTTDFVAGTTGSNIGIYTGANTGNTFGVIQSASSGGSTGNTLSLNPNGGNVGIGTPTPTLNSNGTVLHIHQTNAGDASAIHITNGATGSAAADGLILGRWNTGQPYNILSSYENEDLRLGTNGIEAISIKPSGNVGIGTTTPLSRFTVSGASGVVAAEGTDYPALYIVNTSKTSGTFGRTWTWMNYGSGLYLNGYASTAVNHAPGGPISAMFIADTTGNVGIGTVTPGSYKLATASSTVAWSSGGSILGFCVDTGCLTGYPAAAYPVIKTNSNYIYFDVAGAYAGYVSTAGFINVSSRTLKENFEELDYDTVLHKIDGLQVMKWNYKSDDDSVKHIGPFAEDFHEAFGLNGTDNKAIADSDRGGVALAGVKGLISKVKALEAENDDLRARLEKLEAAQKQ